MVHIRWIALDRVMDVRRDAIFSSWLREGISRRLT